MTHYYAHTSEQPTREDWQPLDSHLEEVANLAATFAASFNAADWARIAGLLHDVGKATPAFQDYLVRSVSGKARRGEVPHAIHGALLARGIDPGLGKLLAYVLAGHHGGLPDGDDLMRKLERPKAVDLEAARQFLEQLDPPALPRSAPFYMDAGNLGFSLSFFLRMLYSCLVDADWLDTEKFCVKDTAAYRCGFPTLADLTARFFPKLDALVAKATPTPVNAIRQEVLASCRGRANDAPGLFSLTVPTGGGKTLSSLAFALEHAQAHGLERIVYVIPYMSIIEQNAQVFREFLGDDAVVEHHSSALSKDARENDESYAMSRRARLATENWDAPIIATTAVQFFESLFAAKPSRCRKLHNLAKSIIILDEAQMLPPPFLLPCLAALKELTARYGATVVLCTATQPAVKKRDEFKNGLDGIREIVPDTMTLHTSLKRVTMEILDTLTDDELAARLDEEEQALCIVNTRRHARELYERMRDAGMENVLHLSASMCPAHRTEVVWKIKEDLKAKRPCRVASTSLVEAGVDIDFPAVYRAAAGIDSIAQAAGRCDREGKRTAAAGSPAGRVYIFEPADHALPRGHFTHTWNAAGEVLRKYNDALAPDAVEHYFRHLFWIQGDKLDDQQILHAFNERAATLDFPFRKVAGKFRIIDHIMRPIIVRWGPESDTVDALINELRFAESPVRALRQLQRYTVQVYDHQLQELFEHGAIEVVEDEWFVLGDGNYSDELGVVNQKRIFSFVD